MKKVHFILLIGLLLNMRATAQAKVKPFCILQGLITKYSSDQDIRFGGSLSGGLLVKSHFGFGINVQAFEGPRGKYEIPVNLEASYFTQEKLSPYFNIQLGEIIYQRTSTFSYPGFSSKDKTTGGYYFSPSAGLLFPFIGRSNVIVTAAYIRSQFRRQVSIAGDPTHSDDRYTRDGYKLGLGFKL